MLFQDFNDPPLVRFKGFNHKLQLWLSSSFNSGARIFAVLRSRFLKLYFWEQRKVEDAH